MEEMTMANTPKKYIGNKPADTLRAAIENEGKWVFYLANEGLSNGLDISFAQSAMNELGEYYAKTTYKGLETAEELSNGLMNRAMELGHEAVIENLDENGFDLVIGYCPMLNMWSQLTDDEDKKKLMCSAACKMYEGIGGKLGFSVEKKCALACGAECCRLAFRKN